jgi:hypothetical protein
MPPDAPVQHRKVPGGVISQYRRPRIRLTEPTGQTGNGHLRAVRAGYGVSRSRAARSAPG